MRDGAGLSTKVAYGLGAVAYGVKDNGFSYFLLFFYSQVLGVPAGLSGLAIFIALMVDAVTDPIVGYWSDNLHARWGRRHPFMYAATLPIGVAFYLLWNPPGDLRGAELFPYLLAFAILVRVTLTFYEIPSTALVSELTDQYDVRTSLLGYRYFFGWWGGVAIAVIMLYLLLTPSAPGAHDGYFNVEGYARYGLIGAVMMMASILISAIGTHGHIPRLKQPPPRQPFTLRRAVDELRETLAHRSFLAIFLSMLFYGSAAGLSHSLNHYFNGFFWEFTTRQVGVITLSAFGSAAIALMVAPWVSRTLGKKRGAIVVGLVAFGTRPLPIFLRLLGWFPENGTAALFYTIFFWILFDVALIISVQILISSMIADVVEDSELRTGRRSEGVFFAAETFARKAVHGLGVLLASAVLGLVEFPEGARPGTVDPETVRQFGLFYAPTLLLLYLAAIAALGLYKIDRVQHEENVARLAATPAAASIPDEG